MLIAFSTDWQGVFHNVDYGQASGTGPPNGLVMITENLGINVQTKGSKLAQLKRLEHNVI